MGLGIPATVRLTALGYLLVVLESRCATRLQEDVEAVGEQGDASAIRAP